MGILLNVENVKNYFVNYVSSIIGSSAKYEIMYLTSVYLVEKNVKVFAETFVGIMSLTIIPVFAVQSIF